ncbi:MAG: trypsin-like peptidase domain-containing protein [Candidatus Rokubacteria bacterium]|nr:trypsin-like peptidase domain-containing protein [Candidatus Rokubacteria bacterium]
MRGRLSLFVIVTVTLLAASPALAADACTESLIALYQRVSPAVVSIQALKINKSKPARRFESVVGSGLLIERDGQILTNAHVVDGAGSLTITLDSGEKVPGKIVGVDTMLDLALVKVDPPSPPVVARLGDSGDIKVGEEVVAIGSAVGLDQTMTRGIVSGLNRLLPGLPDQPMIQTDAPINPGNSGGPLVDRCGAVIGINTFISEDAQSIGFAIPINTAKSVLRELREAGRVVRPWLGIEGRAVDSRLIATLKAPLQPGYLVEIVHEDSPADRAGIKGGETSIVLQGEEYLVGGDIITAIAGAAVRTHDDYIVKLRALKPGQRVKLTVIREGKSREVTLTVAERPRLPSDLAD